MAEVTLHNKTFAPFISEETIQEKIQAVALQIERDYAGKQLLFVGVLNGAFRFVSELMKYISLDCEVTFIKVASYEGTSSLGKVTELIGFNESIENKHVIVVEDIVDTGNTIERITKEMSTMGCSSIKLATLLYKPDAYEKSIPVDYVGIKIPNDFIVGYGLDYNGLGRNLNEIYKIKE